MLRLPIVVLTAACIVSVLHASAALAQKADPEATLRIAWPGPPASFDPHRSASPGDQPYMFFFYDRLTRIADDLSVHPMLATAWRASADGRTLEMTLRKDVVFHDGTRFDAAAVKANLERAKTVGTEQIKNALEGLSEVEAVNPTTVRLLLKRGGGAELPAVLGTLAGAMVSPKAISSGRDIALTPGDGGSGPFVIKDFRLKDKVVFERAKTYWDPAAAGRPKNVELGFVASTATRINGVKSGQLDVIFVSGPETAQAAKESEQGIYKARVVATSVQHALKLHTSKAVWRDRRVRQAVASAINRESLSRDFLTGSCEAANQPVAKRNPAFNPAAEGLIDYNPARARALLHQAGVSNLSFDATVAAGTAVGSIGPVLQAQLKEVGIDMKLSPRPGIEATGAFRSGQHDALIRPLVGGPDLSLYLAGEFFGGDKSVDPQDKELKALADKALDPAIKPAQRNQIYQQVMLRITQDSWAIPICNIRQYHVHTGKVLGVDKMGWTWAGTPDYSTLSKTR